MRGVRALLATTVVVAVVATSLAAASAARARQAEASDVGITEDEIRLAVVADVENPVVPGLFQASVDAVRAWAKNVNKSGGLAGRKVVVDFIDSKLSADEARNAVINACAEDFAMVGTEALFLNNADDMVACADVQGNPIGIPDLAALAIDSTQRCSRVTYLASGDNEFCKTKDAHPQTYRSRVGDVRYFLKKFKDLHGIFTVPADLRETKNAQLPYFKAMADIGVKKDGEGFIDVSARSPQSAMTPVVQVAKDNRSNFVYNGSAPNIMVLLRREAKLQGVDTVKVWACNEGCYDAEFLKQGGADVEGTYSVLTVLPFYSEYKLNPSLKQLARGIGGIENVNGNGVAAWNAALLFEEAVKRAFADGGTLTRRSLFDALKTIHDFDAKGIIGPIDVGNHQSSGRCIVVVQVKNGKWSRVHPPKPGTFDCSPKNIYQHEMDLT